MRAALRTTLNTAEARHGQAVKPFRDLVHMNASPAQKLYMLAKAAHETAKAEESRLIALIALPVPSREELRAWAEAHGTDEGGAVFGVNGEDYDPAKYCHPYYVQVQRIEGDINAWQWFNERIAAENGLVEWAKGESVRVLGARYAQIAKCFDEWPLHGELRERFLAILLAMPSGVKNAT